MRIHDAIEPPFPLQLIVRTPYNLGWRLAARESFHTEIVTKIGLNLIAAYCRRTPVDYHTFNPVIRVIKGDDANAHHLLDRSGFVRAEEIQCIAVPGAHMFRLIFKNPTTFREPGRWTVYQSYFGGRIGAVVNFPGPNKEEWSKTRRRRIQRIDCLHGCRPCLLHSLRQWELACKGKLGRRADAYLSGDER